MLGLDPERGVRKDLDKRDYGNSVHSILQRFHRNHPVLGDLGLEVAREKLETLSRELFLGANNDPEQRAWCLRWLECIPAYLEWCLEQEKQGWYWQGAEVSPPLVDFPLKDGTKLTLKGRLDRVDRHSNGSLRILDYKLKDASNLKRELTLGEDEQLPFYGLIYPEAEEAAFLPLEESEITPIFCDSLQDKSNSTSERIRTIFNLLGSGSGLPANGTPKACSTCSYFGLCRLNWWENP
jgi:ATP-dependent helicase/nuclease subunit B